MTAIDSISAVRQAMDSSIRLIFDFDGTLVDSNRIKRQAFDLVFADYPERMQEIQTYCYGNNHTIRGEKFRHVTERILGLEYTPELDRKCHAIYAQATTDSVANAPEIPGAEAFLKREAPRGLALVSSTPHDILLEILKRRQWLSLFGEIRGAPVNKREWLNAFQNSLQCRAEEFLFFGDTDEDEESALQAGCRFVRVGSLSNNSKLDIEDFTCL